MATAPQLGRPLQVVLSYAHEDESLLDRLAAHLASLERARVIECWHDRDIRAGANWRDQINKAIARADVILLLISPDFIASDYCFTTEMVDALKRHAAGMALVIPILLRPIAATPGQPWAELQGLPRDLRAATVWPNLDEAFADVTRGVLEALERWKPALPATVARRKKDGETFAEDRVFDAAVPSHVQVGETSEIVSLVRTPGSGGLRAILAADDTFAARPEGVRSRDLSLDFQRDEHGLPLPLRLTLVLQSPDFDPPRQTKQIQVPPEGDSALYVFLAAPRRAGLLALQLELLSGDVSIVNHLLRSRAEDVVPETSRRYVVATLPLTTTGVAPAQHQPTLEREPELEATIEAGAPAPRPAPAPSPSDTLTGGVWIPPARQVPSPRSPTSTPPASPSTRVSIPRPPSTVTHAPASPRASARRGFAMPALGTLAATLFVSASAWLLLRTPTPTTMPTTMPQPEPTYMSAPTTTLPTVAPIDTGRPAEARVLARARRLYAERDYAAVVALVEGNPSASAALNQLAGRSLFEMGDYSRAAERFELAARAEPENPTHRELLARARRAMQSTPRTP